MKRSNKRNTAVCFEFETLNYKSLWELQTNQVKALYYTQATTENTTPNGIQFRYNKKF